MPGEKRHGSNEKEDESYDLPDYDPDYDEIGEPYPEGPLSTFPSKRHLIPALVFLVLFYIASAMLTGHSLGSSLWVSGGTVLERKEYWRLFTALFAHRDLGHLLSNAFMFTIFGWLLRAYYGFAVFPIVSLLIGAMSNYLTVFIYPPDIRLLGASGMIYGMAALWLVLYLKNDVSRTFPVRFFRVLGFILVLLLPSTLEPQVSYLAHATGFVAGMAAGIALMRFIPARDPG